MEQLDLDYCFNNEPAPLDFVACGLLAGTVGNISAPGSTGKSFLVAELGMAVCSNSADHQLLRLGIHKEGKVAIFNAEDPKEILNSRIHDISQYLDGSTQEQVKNNLEVYPLMGTQPNITNSAFFDLVLKRCEGKRLAIFDTFTRFHQMNENDNGQMSQVLSYYERIAKETGAAVLFLHHTGKGATLNGQQAEQQASRGASAITDNCRWQGYLQTMTADEAPKYGIQDNERKRYVRFGGSKENYGQATPERWLERSEEGVLRTVSICQSRGGLKVVSRKEEWR